MDDRVKAEYEKILSAAIIKNGSLVSKDASFFNWIDDEYEGRRARGQRHSVSSCGIAKTGQVEEDATWHEFAGTFAEYGDTYKHGMEVHGVTCNCGKIKDRVFRWDAPVGEAIRIVMMELLEDKVKNEPKLRIKKGCCGKELCIFDDRGFGQEGPCYEVVPEESQS